MCRKITLVTTIFFFFVLLLLDVDARGIDTIFWSFVWRGPLFISETSHDWKVLRMVFLASPHSDRVARYLLKLNFVLLDDIYQR